MVEQSFINAFSLEGNIAVITGAATGLGNAMAKCLTAAGAKVIVVGIESEEILKKACEDIGNDAGYYQFNVTDTDHTEALVKRIIDDHGKIDILINNAGIHCKKPVEDTSINDFNRVLDVHLVGAFALTKAVIPSMRSNKNGSIIFISSMSAFFGLTSVTAYSAAKSAVLGLTRSIASEVSCDNVRVNAIAPGFIDSEMFRKAVEGDEDRQNKILGRTPMNKYGDAMDIGWAAVYLCSPAASFVTGTCLAVDGGCLIGF